MDPRRHQGPPDQVEARIKAFEELVESQETRIVNKAQIVIQVPERLGGKVIEAKNISKAYGDKLLFENLSCCRRAASSA
jgi:ATPase subunit of ABC transporter with duplicated ATPase domains